MKKELIAPFVVVLLLFTSCNRGEVFFKFQQIKDSEWSSKNYLEFELDSLDVDPLLSYDLQLDVVYSNAYPYKDLWLNISHNLVDTIFEQDLLEVRLTGDDGKKLGNGNSGLYQLSVPYKTALKLDSVSKYHVRIGHAMREYDIKGIDKVGLKVSVSR